MNDSMFDILRPGESTASAIVRLFAANGVPREHISSKSLQPFYRAMSATNTRARGRTSPLAVKTSGFDVEGDAVHAVIIETREHPNLEFVVCQVADRLDLSLQIFHSPQNKRFIESSKIRELIEAGRVLLSEIVTRDFSLRDYNALLLDRSFWDSLTGRGKILTFQTDSILCENSIYTLEDFIHLDYVGSNWNRKRPVGIVIDGGSGGLSLRDWHVTMECLNRFPPHFWPGGEDGYFAFHFDLMGACVASESDCGRFSTQVDFVSQSFGAHQIQNLPELVLGQFLEYCPEARLILMPSAG